LSDQPQPVSPDLYTEEYFLTACEGYEAFLQSDGENLSRRLAAAFALAAVEPGMNVLDVACGRGEIVRHCARLGAHAYGFDYAHAAIKLSRALLSKEKDALPGTAAVVQADAKRFPFPSKAFDRVLMFDIVEHLHPWELHTALQEARRVLKDDGRLIIRRVRTLMGQGAAYPADPRRFLVEHNQDVHVNEQSMLSLKRVLRQAGFDSHVWLDSPPQDRRENIVLDTLRAALFRWPPFRWFFEREVFAIAEKRAVSN